MWEAIVALLPGLGQLLIYLVSKSSMKDEQKKRFYDWVKEASQDYGSVALHKASLRQLEEFKNRPFKETE